MDFRQCFGCPGKPVISHPVFNICRLGIDIDNLSDSDSGSSSDSEHNGESSSNETGSSGSERVTPVIGEQSGASTSAISSTATKLDNADNDAKPDSSSAQTVSGKFRLYSFCQVALNAYRFYPKIF